MQSNKPTPRSTAVTHGGTPAFPHLSPIQQLRRTVMSCMLFESEFYEDGKTIADRILELVPRVDPLQVAAIAIEARTRHNLRHVSLLLAVALARQGKAVPPGVVAKTIESVICRADELSEFLALYWNGKKTPLAKQVKKGLALAFRKFDAYQLSKYDRAREIRLRDVLFLVHANPKDDVQADAWKRLVDGTLPAADTWEVALSSGADKKETWERMLSEHTLGYMALLRNLRNMIEAGVDIDLIRRAILARRGGAEKVLPFRYVAAARFVPMLEPQLDMALCEAIMELPRLPGTTCIMVDVSGSMNHKLSEKSDMTRMDAAASLASLIRGETLRVLTFSDVITEVPPRRGLAGVDAIKVSQPHRGTRLSDAVDSVNRKVECDRLIVITDEQDTTGRPIPLPVAPRAYMVNVASAKHGVGYGRWTHLDGFSEGIIRWIVENERQAAVDD